MTTNDAVLLIVGLAAFIPILGYIGFLISEINTARREEDELWRKVRSL